MSSRLAPHSRIFALLGVVQYAVSLAFLLLASTTDISRLPAWLGLLDVVLAFALIATLALLKIALGWQNPTAAAKTSYAILTYLVPVLLAAIWFFRDQLILNTLLPGLAWRAYVLFEFLPVVLTVLNKRQT